MDDTYYAIGYDRADAIGSPLYPRYEDAVRLAGDELTVFSVPVEVHPIWTAVEAVD